MALNLSVPGGDVQLTGNPCRVKITGGNPPAGSVNYQLVLSVLSDDGKLDGAPFADAKKPNDSGEAEFNVSGYVDQPIESKFQYPISGGVVSYPTQAFNVRFQPGEIYLDENGVQTESWGAISDVYQFLKGGSSPRQNAYWNSIGSNFHETYINAGRFLTTRPWGDSVHPNQPVKLWYMVTANLSTYFWVRITYTDGSEEFYNTDISLNTNNLYEFNCNAATLGVNIEEANKRATFFDVWLGPDNNPANAISDSRRFHYNWRPCERPFFVLFTNSFGGIDDVYFEGFGTEKLLTEGEPAYRPPQKSNTIYTPTLIVPQRQGQNMYTLNSGYKTSTEMRFWRDLLVSRQMWLLYPDLSVSTYNVMPVYVKNSDTTLVDYSKDLWSMVVDLAEAHRSQYSFDNRIQS